MQADDVQNRASVVGAASAVSSCTSLLRTSFGAVAQLLDNISPDRDGGGVMLLAVMKLVV
jgi:hypothetical protein